MIFLPSFFDVTRPLFCRCFNAGYIVPGVGLFPFIFSSSSAISSPYMGLFERNHIIKNESIPLISQDSGAHISSLQLSSVTGQYWTSDIFKYYYWVCNTSDLNMVRSKRNKYEDIRNCRQSKERQQH